MSKLLLGFALQNASLANSIPTPSQFKQWVRASLRVPTELTIRIVDTEEARALNLQYRGKDYATNVLTFALTEQPHVMGDIVLCAPVVIAEASQQSKTITAHFAHLTVHGVLHLYGYDHQTSGQAELMEAIEVTVLTKLGYANPYCVTEENA